jgi:tRNA G18 (ribose-2'-O)-methylase SpoU
VISPRRAAHLRGLDANAILRRLLKALDRLERDWDQPGARHRARLRARALAEQAAESGAALPPGARDLARRLDSQLEERELAELIVPLERALERRVRDEDFLPVTDSAAPAGTPMPVSLVADNLRSSFNVGGVFRSAECFGVSRVFLTGYSAGPGDPATDRAAMGTAARLTWSRERSALEVFRRLRAEGHRLVALETGAGSISMRAFTADFPLALAIGNERFGLSEALLAEADQRVAIPTFGIKASLNVVAALAIALHEIRFQFGSRARDTMRTQAFTGGKES